MDARETSRLIRLARSIAWREARAHRLDHDDVLSDAFLGLARAIRGRDPARPMVAYAYACIHGEILTGRIKRGAGRGKPRPVMFELGDREADTIPDPRSRDPLLEVLSADLWRAVDSLPEREAAVVRLFYEQDLPYQEIAELLGLSKTRIDQLLAQARRHLRDALAD